MSGQATGISGISVPATGMPHFVSAAPVRPASPARVSVLEAAEAGGPREQSELLRFQQSVMARSLSPHRQNPEPEMGAAGGESNSGIGSPLGRPSPREESPSTRNR